MKIYVNDTPLSIFSGCRIRDAILKYCIQTKKSLCIDDLIIRDAWGNIVADDATVHDGEKIFIENNN